MLIEFVGRQLSFGTDDGGRRRVVRGDRLVVGTDIPEETFAQYAHRFRIVEGDAPTPAARVRVVTPESRLTHTGFGWYSVKGVSGKYRKEEALRLAGE